MSQFDDNVFDYEELQLIIEMIELNLALKQTIILDHKTGNHNYLQSQKTLLNKCYRLMTQDEFRGNENY